MSTDSTSGSTGASGETRLNRSTGPLRVIVADDSAVGREPLRRFVERWGDDVSLASDGSEAWDLLQDGAAPTIAILDCIIPRVERIRLCLPTRVPHPRP